MKTVYVDLCFQGWLRGVAVKVQDDVTAKDFQKRLNAGDESLSLTSSIEDANTSEIELSDFEVIEDT